MAAEDNKMEISCSAAEKDHKAESQAEGPNQETGEPLVRSEKTSKATQKNKMEVSRSAKENKNKAEKQPKISNRRGTPSLINQAENTPPDNLTPMDTSESKNKKTQQKHKSEKETNGLKTEGTKKSLMKCPECQAAIAPAVTFCKQKDDQCEFNIGLHQDNGDDHTALFENRLAFTEGAGNLNKNDCLHCEQSIIYHSFAKRNNKMGGFDIELSINISKEDKLEETLSAMVNNLGGTQSQNRNCDEVMEQDDGDGSSSEKSPGCKADHASKQRGNTVLSKSSENRNSSSRKPEQSNQTSSKGWFLSNILQSPAPVVKVHYTPTSDTFGADTAIMKQLKNNLKSSVQLEETTRKNCNIIIVFCPVGHSYESEVKSAMEKEAVSSSGKPFIVVLMHHTRHPDYSTAGCDVSEVLKNVFYVHVFYHETNQGLWRCKQNDTAIKTIENKLKAHKQ